MPRRRVATAQTHLSHHRPAPERVSDTEWSWPYWKFGYKHGGVLFGDLHAEFNSVRCAIQDPYGWHLDVNQIANEVDTREAFFARLRQRQSERFAELEEAWNNTTSLLVAEPFRWDTKRSRKDLWFNFVRISRNFSYDSLVGFFGEFIKDNPPRPKLPEPPKTDAQGPETQSRNEPVCEEPIREEPVREEPVREEPVREEPVREEPVREEPVREEPVFESPIREEPVREGPNTDEIEPEQSSKISDQGKITPPSVEVRNKKGKGKGATQKPKQAAASPNRVVKRQAKGPKAERVTKSVLRRSPRLQELKERGSVRGS